MQLKKYFVNLSLIIAAVLLILSGQSFAGTVSGTVKALGLRSLDGILLYLTKAPAADIDLSGVEFVMDQKNLTFIPHILPVPVGSTVVFPNNDKVDHNVFSLSRTKSFNFGSYKPGATKSVTFDKPGIVELRCDVHAEMAAFIMVLKNPYWAFTNSEGKFQLPDSNYWQSHGINEFPVPAPGKYYLKAWHEKLRTVRTPVAIPEEGNIDVDLTLQRGAPGVLYK